MKIMKLKTLKDLGREYVSATGRETLERVDVKDLKAEAVKHYKAIKNKELIIDVLSYIRWNNNLKEEDLK